MSTEKFNSLLETAKKAILSEKEKEQIRFSIVNFIKDNPHQEKILSPNKDYHWYSSFIRFALSGSTLRYTSMSLATLAVCVFFGSGIAFAAKNTLPGDFLYPVKTQVNEKILGWLTTSGQAKAELYISLANKRLEEAEKVALQGRLNAAARAQVEISFSENISKAQLNIKDIGGQDSADVSANLNSTLQGTLQAHSKILDSVITDRKKSHSDSSGAEVESFKQKVATHLDSVIKARKESEARVFVKSASDVAAKVTAENKQKEAQNRMQAVSNFLVAKKSDISPEVYLVSEADITTANYVILQGEAKIQTGDYAGAFSLFQQAMRIADEVRINVLASTNLNINLQLPKIEIEDRDTDSNSNQSINKKTEIQNDAQGIIDVDTKIKGVLGR